MTTISSLTPGLQLTPTQSSTTATSRVSSTHSSSGDSVGGATIVTIPWPVVESPIVYTPEGTLADATPVITWVNGDTDAVSKVMAGDYMSATMSGQFQNLGSALLDRFKTTDSNFMQSVTAATTTGGDATALGAQGVQADVKLTVKTATGVEVDIEMDSDDGTLAVSVTNSGPLSDSERSALAKLADGFQQAVNGLSGSPPSLNLSGLTQYDPSVLSSVNLQFNETGDGSNSTSAGIALNSSSKSVKLTDSEGTINLKVDTGSDSAILGSSAQRNQAIVSYLNQFDEASQQGHGNSELMSLFKDAFTQLNGDNGTTTQALPGTAYTPWLAQADSAMLTGLPDFTGSVTDTTVSSNPLMPDETDNFLYQVSQSTQTQGNSADGSIAQTQQSVLKAAYHESLTGGAVRLTPSLTSQNYDYVQVDDAASSTVDIASQDGKLVNATLDQSSNQSTHESQYVKGVLASNVTTPDKTSSSKDLLSLLKPFIENSDAKQDSSAWQQELSSIHGMILLNPSANR